MLKDSACAWEGQVASSVGTESANPGVYPVTFKAPASPATMFTSAFSRAEAELKVPCFDLATCYEGLVGALNTQIEVKVQDVDLSKSTVTCPGAESPHIATEKTKASELFIMPA